jgi:glycosyltransferase involved in cell wall biosynthesis
MSELLTVSIPTYNTDPRLLKRAISSVLKQDYENIRLVVINDGGKKPKLPEDSRVFTIDLEENRGRYFCDAVTLLSLDGGYFAVHDSDDWSEKNMYSSLMSAAKETGAAYAPYWRHEIGKDPYVWQIKDNPKKKFITRVSWVSGVYSVERMWRAGGINPSFRVGFDTLHTLLMMRTGKFGKVDNPFYHYEKNSGSLTMSRDTGMKTKIRLDAKKRLIFLHNRAQMDIRRKKPLKNLIYESASEDLRQEAEAYAAHLKSQFKLAK